MKFRFWSKAVEDPQLATLRLERQKLNRQLAAAEATLRSLNRTDARREIVGGHTLESSERLETQMAAYKAAVAEVERLRIEIIRLNSAISIAKHGN